MALLSSAMLRKQSQVREIATGSHGATCFEKSLKVARAHLLWPPNMLTKNRSWELRLLLRLLLLRLLLLRLLLLALHLARGAQPRQSTTSFPLIRLWTQIQVLWNRKHARVGQKERTKALIRPYKALNKPL